MYPLIRFGDGPGRIKSIIVVLLVLSGIGYFLMPEDQAVIETRTEWVEVVSLPESGSEGNNTSPFHVTKVRLPDGSHAYINLKSTSPKLGDTVEVLVKVSPKW